jgi:lysophospholipase
MAGVQAADLLPAQVDSSVRCSAPGRDRIVLTEATRAFAARLPRGKYVELEGAEHEMPMERDAIRAQFWKEFDGFVDEAI